VSAALGAGGTWVATKAPAKPDGPIAAAVRTLPVPTVPVVALDLDPVVQELKGLRADLAERAAPRHVARKAPVQ
jgi:hypothetical protein